MLPSTNAPHQVYLTWRYWWTRPWVHYLISWQEWLTMFHSLFTCFWPLLILALFLVCYLVEKTSIPCVDSTAGSETSFMFNLWSCIIIGFCLFSFSINFLINIGGIIKQFFVVFEKIFYRIPSFKCLSCFSKVCIQFLFSHNFFIIVRVFRVLKSLGPLILQLW